MEADNGDTAEFDVAYFETGKMDTPWTAPWIAAAKEDDRHPVFSKTFAAAKEVKAARLYICGLGLFEAYFNGKKLGEEYLLPLINDYMEAYQRITFDVTEAMQQENKLNVVLGKGWYMSMFGLELRDKLFGDEMKLTAELAITYADGTGETIVTDESWSVYGSEVADSGIYFGETIDRTLYKEKDNTPYPARITEPAGNLCDRYSCPLTSKETLYPVEIITTPAGETVLDFGQNHAGFMEFDADFPAGTVITMQGAEILQDGNFYHGNYRDAVSMLTYISDGRKERVRPRFTYFGYRYIKVTGWVGELTKESVCSRVLYSDMDRLGRFECSDAKINRLYENSLWSLKSNFVDMPTDCPQRSERLGWTGDAQIFTATASWHMDTRAFYRKYLKDLRTDQVRAGGAVASFLPSVGSGFGGAASVWGDVGTFMPSELYRFYGQLADVRQYYPLMKDWLEYMFRFDESDGASRLLRFPFQFGDWVALDGITDMSYKGSTDDNFIGSVYYCRSAELVADMALRLGEMEDANKYRKLAGEIRAAILDEYFAPSGRLAADTQASYIIALKFGIYRDKQMVIDQLKDRFKKDCYKIRCGFVGAPMLCMTLCENGLSDLAYEFLFQEGFPSWLYEVNLGATTIWERWNSVMPDGHIAKNEMNSLNHYAYGSVVEFFYTFIAGISPKAPGLSKVLIAPIPTARFSYVNCSYDSASGKYVSNWHIGADGSFTLEVEVPFGCTADVVLPDCDGTAVTMNGAPCADVLADGCISVSAGKYVFAYQPTKDYLSKYSPSTKLMQVADDAAVMDILKEECPQVYGIIASGNMEHLIASFEELKYMGFLGIDPAQLSAATEKIYALR